MVVHSGPAGHAFPGVRARENTTALGLIDGGTLMQRCLSDTALGAAFFHRVLHVVVEE